MENFCVDSTNMRGSVRLLVCGIILKNISHFYFVVSSCCKSGRYNDIVPCMSVCLMFRSVPINQHFRL